MRDLSKAEIGHVYGAGGKSRNCRPNPCNNGSRSKGSRSKGSKSKGSKSKGSRSKGRCY